MLNNSPMKYPTINTIKLIPPTREDTPAKCIENISKPEGEYRSKIDIGNMYIMTGSIGASLGSDINLG